ncbi:MAG: hypothetical protein AAFP97_12180 [Pseudomonadota bacterium]
MNIFSDDGSVELNKLELARKAIAVAGGAVVGNGASHIKERQDAQMRQVKASDAAKMTALQIALQEESYRRLYDHIWERVHETQDRLDHAILENAEDIERLEANAMRSEDGRMIFVTEDRFVYADGSPVDPKDAPNPSTIPDNATRYDDYRIAIIRRDDLARIQTDTLDPIRGRMSDPDNPPGEPKLRDFAKELDRADEIIHSPELSSPETKPAVTQVSNLDMDMFVPG